MEHLPFHYNTFTVSMQHYSQREDVGAEGEAVQVLCLKDCRLSRALAHVGDIENDEIRRFEEFDLAGQVFGGRALPLNLFDLQFVP